jgi:hypothetical protein
MSDRKTILLALAERCEKATGPDFEIDRDILMNVDSIGDYDWAYPPKYSASLDTAMSFCERMLPGWCWRISSTNAARIWKYGEPHTVVDCVSTPVLAIDAAILRTLAAQEK